MMNSASSMLRDLARVIGGALMATSALAQGFPERPITMIVPYAAGSGVDLVARFMAPKMVERMGQPVVVDNRAGAGGIIGSKAVERSKPDGYTFLLASSSLAAPILLTKEPLDLADSLTPLGYIG